MRQQNRRENPISQLDFIIAVYAVRGLNSLQLPEQYPWGLFINTVFIPSVSIHNYKPEYCGIKSLIHALIPMGFRKTADKCMTWVSNYFQHFWKSHCFDRKYLLLQAELGSDYTRLVTIQ